MLRLMLSAVLGLSLAAVGLCADAPKRSSAVNLDDLKYAITMAAKRGENVDAITQTLAAFEKAIAKNAAKPSEAVSTYPEMTALREAVESTAKKGENVEAISKELGIIEKALTGHAYVRPKPPVVQPEPEPEFVPMPGRPFRGRRDGFGGGFGGFGGGRMGVGGGNGGPNIHATSVAMSNDGQFAIKSLQGDVTYSITGQTKANTPLKIAIQVGEKKIEADEVKKVPNDYRPTVERLLKMVNR